MAELRDASARSWVDVCDSSLGNGLKGRVERGTLCSEKRLKDYFGKRESKYSRKRKERDCLRALGAHVRSVGRH